MRFVLILLLSTCCWADTLTLEFAQEGDPGNPRALIVVHNMFENRDSLKPFLAAWSDRSWARDQYCSVYCFEYRSGGLRDLRTPEEIGKSLYSKIRSGRYKKGRADDVNPNLRTEPTDERQPTPSLKEDVELLFAGSGYGGLVVREAARLAKLDQRKTHRLAFLGTPLDGLSNIELVLGLTVPERSRSLGLSNPVSFGELSNLSTSWWLLTDVFHNATKWSDYFAPLLQETRFYSGTGAFYTPFHPTDNVLYGKNRKVLNDGKNGDGFLPRPVTWGKESGPIAWIKETELDGTSFSQLSEKGGAVMLELADKQLLHNYLAMREGIELAVKGEGELPPVGFYWDERHNRFMEAYASKKGLYEMMWGVTQ